MVPTPCAGCSPSLFSCFMFSSVTLPSAPGGLGHWLIPVTLINNINIHGCPSFVEVLTVCLHPRFSEEYWLAHLEVVSLSPRLGKIALVCPVFWKRWREEEGEGGIMGAESRRFKPSRFYGSNVWRRRFGPKDFRYKHPRIGRRCHHFVCAPCRLPTLGLGACPSPGRLVSVMGPTSVFSAGTWLSSMVAWYSTSAAPQSMYL